MIHSLWSFAKKWQIVLPLFRFFLNSLQFVSTDAPRKEIQFLFNYIDHTNKDGDITIDSWMIKVHTPTWNCLGIIKDIGIIKFIQGKTLNIVPRASKVLIKYSGHKTLYFHQTIQQIQIGVFQWCAALWSLKPCRVLKKKSIVYYLIGRMSLCSVLPQDCSNSENIFVILNNFSTFLYFVVSQTIPRAENCVAIVSRKKTI